MGMMYRAGGPARALRSSTFRAWSFSPYPSEDGQGDHGVSTLSRLVPRAPRQPLSVAAPIPVTLMRRRTEYDRGSGAPESSAVGRVGEHPTDFGHPRGIECCDVPGEVNLLSQKAVGDNEDTLGGHTISHTDRNLSGVPRTVVVVGTAITSKISPINSSRVRIRAGRCFSWGGSCHQTSPRLIPGSRVQLQREQRCRRSSHRTPSSLLHRGVSASAGQSSEPSPTGSPTRRRCPRAWPLRRRRRSRRARR